MADDRGKPRRYRIGRAAVPVEFDPELTPPPTTVEEIDRMSDTVPPPISEQLRPDGRVIAELLNPYYWAHRNVTRHHPPGALAEEMDVVRTYRFDAMRGRVEDRVTVIGASGRTELPVQSLRCWTPVELVSMFKSAGFAQVNIYGSDGWDVPEEALPVHPEESVFLWVVATL